MGDPRLDTISLAPSVTETQYRAYLTHDQYRTDSTDSTDAQVRCLGCKSDPAMRAFCLHPSHFAPWWEVSDG
jgi:hypothetical protein